MSRKHQGDEAEYRPGTNASPTGGELPLFGGALAGDEPLPDALPVSVLLDTEQYLDAARKRIGALTSLSALQERTLTGESPLRPPWHEPTRKAVTQSERAEQRAAKGLGAVLRPNAPAGTTRQRDASTSLAAALTLAPRLSEMQAAVLAAFEGHGAMTDEQLEQLPEFREYKYSTARKRRTELVAKGLLASCGKASNGSGSARMTVHDLASRVRKIE